MNAFELLKEKLKQGMTQGNMHACLRDTGRLAGGYAATGALSAVDLFHLEKLAGSLSINPGEGESKWSDAVIFGRRQPVYWNEVEYSAEKAGRSIGWNDEIGGSDDLKVVNEHWLEDEEIKKPSNDWNPVSDLITYLETLFQSEEQVGYVTESWFNENAEKHLPKKGCFDRSAGQLIELLNDCKGDIGSVIGDTNSEVGAWIRFNPLDGNGVKDQNVTSYRYALVESDVVDIPRQYALLKELELPIATLVHSGGKSLHAVVKVEADSYEEYRERVDYLYQVCEKNGLAMDRQNRNPSRLSRMPGVARNGEKQFLLATGIGKSSWLDWREWIEDLRDELPDIEELTIDGEPGLAPELIKGLLREGHKMLLAGPSKAGKSFSLQQLSIAISQGLEWMGWKCTKGRVLYVNLELDKRSSKHRFWNIHQHLNIENNGNIDVWNLRGSAASMDKLAPKLIRRSAKKGYKAVIIDPIYKVLTGDENSAEEMAHFCNQFDKICVELGAATIYCHHHSKGSQGQKTSRDRSSGSGVFARDPDAIVDLIELEIDEGRRKQISQRWECDALHAELTKIKSDWWEKCSQDDALVPERLLEWAGEEGINVPGSSRLEAQFEASITTGWRLEGTLREFATFPAKEIFFRYPIHVVDSDGLLKDAKADGEEDPYEKFQRVRSERNKASKKEADESFNNAFEMARDDNGNVKVSALAEVLGKTEKTVRLRVNKSKSFTLENGFVFRKGEGENDH
ncbi:AAA family ATPase [Rubellicoccus peritrichatus]|uniref:AAA family ATPase n=1 Tax=Rubellicoccus peritrichatus TaxID=3080537 RepID=A0AAQ3QUJ0_9BACT|nr:AAA family ATPase [Puniceicoccus sp. CR14]WOO40390.1 AAA family ATPase [Puniceicoccus sp. CR14]WOO40439.1 AAA family ATPase [Puniceicoccus sp. CR14]WOO40488.1 AAA family ATPase [Puniceicoccus sp. CR14]WOO40537.1 AAA family ATPase [Puniceicoccus sp. CR14]